MCTIGTKGGIKVIAKRAVKSKTSCIDGFQVSDTTDYSIYKWHFHINITTHIQRGKKHFYKVHKPQDGFLRTS